ncbi:hypothetical protein [Bradyrhizobium sp. CCBAU 51627]|uniref:hypothetical protein n=1 Tax=Bradyrhizobium sp. CCBAU 51627 TaxID=1325088 RepID=UPI00230542AC|nr:hypothetical protein [Bradyrhizobium sp. CCBAU 51627]
MSSLVGIYPNANGQTNRVIAALDKIIEDCDNCIASSCGSVGRSRSALPRTVSSSSACPGSPTIACSQAYIDLFDERHPAVAVRVLKVVHNREYA